MATISIGIIVILLIYVVIGVLDQISVQVGFYSPLFAATFTGLIMGDLPTGLLVGATLQLMTLGVATYGGASVPDFLTGAIIGTAYAILSHQGVEYGIGVAVPIGLLLTQTDILGRMTNTFWQRLASTNAEQGNAHAVELCNVLGIFSWTLSRVIPLFLGLFFGEKVVTLINSHIPTFVMNGLSAAGSILPAMGIAILMHYLPLKKYWPYFVLGFVLMAYFASNFSILGVALVGVALAGIYALNQQQKINTDQANKTEAVKINTIATNPLYANEEVEFND